MITVKRNQIVEYEAHKFVTAASDIGLTPGDFPGQLECEPGIGNGQPFIRKRYVTHDGEELIEVVYWQAFACVELHVHND